MPPAQKNRQGSGQRSSSGGRSSSRPSGPSGSSRPSDNRPRNFTYGNAAPQPPQPDTHNPSEQQYEHDFDFEQREHTASAPKQAREADGGTAFKGDNRPIAQRETAPSWDTNLGGGGGQQKQQQQGGGGKGGRFNPLNAKKRIKQWAIGGLVSLILGISAAVPAVLSGAFAHMKELISDWGNKNNNSYFSKRTQKFLKKKFFQADANCKEGAKCRFKQGVSDKEIDKMKKAGLNPDIGKDGDKKFVKSFDTKDVEGKSVKINADNFEEHYGGNVKFRAQMDTIAKPKSMLMRGKTTLKLVFDKFGIKRNREISGKDDKERTRNFRADEYGEGNQTEKANSAPDGGEEDKNGDSKRIAGVDDAINDAAQKERAALESSNFDKPPSVVPDASNLDLDPSKAKEVAGGIVKGGLKGAVLGVFSAIDKACSGYQLIRALIFGAKVYKVIALIKYVGIFMTLADKQKAGDSKADEIGYIASLLFKPSNKKESYGKTFFQSEGFNLAFQGKIADHRGLSRYTTGTPFMKFLQRTKTIFEGVGANKTTCKQVKSWYGQGALIVGGLVIGFFTAGSTSIAGVVASTVMSVIFSVIEAYVTPLLIQYAAGTIAPDVTDAEGGYGVGNAAVAGIGAFGNFTGSANGERVLTTADATSVEMESNKEMAFQTKVDNYGKSPFSLDSATSIPSQLALAFAPAAASPLGQSTFQNIASIVASPLSLFGSSFGGIVTGGVSAQSDIAKGGQYCADEDYKAMDLAVDAFCNRIPGETNATINDPKYAPDAVDKWMFDNGHADPDSGEAKSDDYKKYIASCTDSSVPSSPDGGGSDVGEDVDTRWCSSKDEKFNYFRFYTTNNSLESAHNDSVNGTLGLDEGATASNTSGSMTAEQCKTVADKGAQVPCNGALFTPYYYKYGGGHGSIDQIKQFINDAVNGQNKGAAILDCSGFVRTAYYMTYGVDVGGGSADTQAHSKFFKPVADQDAKPGDILWHISPFDHTAIVVSNDTANKKWTIIEASTDGKPIAQSTANYSEFEAFTYTGAQ
jgi:cell wall-associated NlpC family hydrolase